jgi:hypothetical protein
MIIAGLKRQTLQAARLEAAAKEAGKPVSVHI